MVETGWTGLAVLVVGVVVMAFLCFSAVGQPEDVSHSPGLAVTPVNEEVANLEGSLWQTRQELGIVSRRAQKNEREVDAIRKIVDENTVNIRQVEERLTAAIERVAESNELIRRQLDEISHDDEASGKRVLHFQMDIAAARQRFQDAIRRVAPKEGRLSVRNDASRPYRIRVNEGEISEILPGRSQVFLVSLGTATTELVDYELFSNWAIGPPDYQQRVVIKESETRSRLMPPTVGWSPWFYDPASGEWVRVWQEF